MEEAAVTLVQRTVRHGLRVLHEHAHYIAAIFFAVVQLLVLLAFVWDTALWPLLFWYCNNVSFFYAVAFHQHNLQFVKGLNYVGLLPQLLWVSDFISHLFGFDLANTANYIFVQDLTFSNEVTVFLHLTVPFVALAYTLTTRPRPYSLLYSLVYIIALYVVTLAGTAPADDMNCVFNACSQYPFPMHVLLWPLYMIMLSLGGYAIHEGLYRLSIRLMKRLHPVSTGDTLNT